MVNLLNEEMSVANIDKDYDDCCDEVKPIAPEVEKINNAVKELCSMASPDLAANCKTMEQGYKDNCAEIRKQRMLIRKAIRNKDTNEAGSQCELVSGIVIKENVTEVPKIVRVPVEIKKDVKKIVEKPVYSTKDVSVTVDVVKTEEEIVYKNVEKVT
jgi:hypothetical protein